MANFRLQVEALTGLGTINDSTVPTLNELTQFLQDGTRDVVNRFSILYPQMVHRFTKTTNSHSHVTATGRILSAVREHNSSTILRPCALISPQDRYLAKDKSSLKYRSEYNPGYYELEGQIHCVPAPSGTGDNDFIVTQIHYDTEVNHGDSVPDNFPSEYAYIVAIYASIKSLERALASKKIPVVGGITEELTAAMDAGAIGTSADQRDFSKWWDVAGDIIEDEEDPELGAVHLQKIQSYIQAYATQLQGNQADYQWMLARHDYLQGQYNQIFAGFVPKQQQAQEGRQ
tara:strand:- start:6645 stop:7508 length:864 start_codon:yes stop_codon:yes gene_type:complete